MKVKIKIQKNEEMEVDLLFPIYRRHDLEWSTIFTKVLKFAGPLFGVVLII